MPSQCPDVVTLTIDPENAAGAIALSPDCSRKPCSTSPSVQGTKLICSELGIRKVQSFPDAVPWLELVSDAISGFDFSTHSKLIHLELTDNRIAALDGFTFPTQLEELSLKGNALRRVPRNKLPTGLIAAYLMENNIQTIDEDAFPDGLQFLYLQKNALEAIDFILPAKLRELHADGNPLRQLENFTMPATLTTFTCPSCGVSSIRGVAFSSTLQMLQLQNNSITHLEIREADVSIVQRLPGAGLDGTTKCLDTTAKLTKLSNGVSACVISDDRFTSLYRQQRPRRTIASQSHSGSGGAMTHSPIAQGDTKAKSSTPIALIAGIFTLAMALLIVAFAVFARYRKNQRNRRSGKDTRTAEATGNTSSMNKQLYSSEYLSNDIRNDEYFMPFRIQQDEINYLHPIARGGFGIIYLATMSGERVAVKKLLPERAKDHAVIMSFMDEIRLCAKLEHPKIVQFIGVAWNTLQDLAVVMEYMEHGDLSSMLNNQRKTVPSDWFRSNGQLKAKSLLALDVIEALVYLHSFDTPIIHRDLKARNVLVDSNSGAKLTDFGISREMTIDETMTGEIGTVAWIAPEVLQGAHYDQQADIYSFGVFLVELDKCRHPYSDQLPTNSSTQGYTNTRIAMLVSTGVLKPVVSTGCPDEIRQIAERCLQYEASDRPSAVEIHYALRCTFESSNMNSNDRLQQRPSAHRHHRTSLVQ